MYSTVTLCLHRGQWGSSHCFFFFPFKNDGGSSVRCMQVGRRVCVCCQVRSVPCSVSVCVSACARTSWVTVGGRWDFTFFRCAVYQTNLLRAFSRLQHGLLVYASFLRAMLLFTFTLCVVVPRRLFVCLLVCCCMEACGPLLSSSMLKVSFGFVLFFFNYYDYYFFR